MQEKMRFAGIDPYSGFMGIYFSYFGESAEDAVLWTVQYLYGETDTRVILYIWMVMILLISLTWAFNIAVIRMRHDYLVRTEQHHHHLQKTLVPAVSSPVPSETVRDLATPVQDTRDYEIQMEAHPLFLEDQFQTRPRFSEFERDDHAPSVPFSPFLIGYYWRMVVLQHYQILIFSTWVLLFSYYNFVTSHTILFFYSTDPLRRCITGLFRMFSFAVLFVFAFMYHYGNQQYQKDTVFLRRWKSKPQ